MLSAAAPWQAAVDGQQQLAFLDVDAESGANCEAADGEACSGHWQNFPLFSDASGSSASTQIQKTLKGSADSQSPQEFSSPVVADASESIGVAPAGLLIYYAYPSGINGTFSVDGAAAEFAQYPFVVLGEGLEQVGHPDHTNTVAILNHATTTDTMFFGYVDLGVSTSNFSFAEIHQRIDAWQAAGADGIFLDDYGYDFDVTRARQNDAVDYAHGAGLPVVANGFFIDQVFGDHIDAEFNPSGTATQLASTDYYLYESYQIRNGVFVDEATWRAKANALADVRTTLPINVFAVTTNVGPAFDQQKLDYAYWSATLDGYAAFGWGEEDFSSVTASAPLRPRPAADPGAAFNSPINGSSRLFTRDTDTGRIAVDAQTFQAGFNVVDFGDAPDTGGGTGPGNYQTTAADGGARHLVGGPRLGASVDFEAAPNVYLEGLVNQPYGYGDNTFGSDEDGVTFKSLLQSSPTIDTAGSVVVDVQNSAGTAKLDAWLDFNADGDFADSGEHIFTNVALSAGENELTFTVPAGAVSGKTFARFRLSTAGNLAPTGLANDGEVEDYAVLIGGTSSLAVVENAILSHLLPNGILKSGNGPSFYDHDGHPWYIVDPYFSAIAVRALLAAPNDGSVDKFTVAANQLDFWLSHIQRVSSLPSDRNATIPRAIVDQNGSALAFDQTVEGTTDGGATYVVYDPATIGADADDSALALILSLATEFWSSGGPASVLNSQRANLELVGSTLASLIEADGLPRPFVDPSNPYQIKQTLDGVEVLQALRQFSDLQRDFFLAPAQAAIYESLAETVATAIQDLLFDQNSQLYKQYAGAGAPDLNTWYPIVFDQVWPIITGLLPANSPRARHLLDEVYAAWDGSPNGSWTNRSDSGWLAWAALQAGDTALASTAVAHILPWALQNSFQVPATPLTVADLGFLLQTMLPGAAGPSNTIEVDGTAGDDKFRFAMNAVGDYKITVNGELYVLGHRNYLQVNFHGAGGDDSITVTGGAGAETAVLRVGSVKLSSSAYAVNANGVETIRVYAGAGDDRAYMYDSINNDNFYGRNTYSYLRGTGFFNRVEGFDRVYAFGNTTAAGGLDRAYLYDSAGDDTFRGRPAYGEMTGAGFSNRATGFDRVYAFGNTTPPGGLDRAYLYDSSGNDTFKGRPTYSELSGGGFFNRATGFDQVYAYATTDAGGTGDRAFFYDSAGNDSFYGRATHSYMLGGGFYNWGKGFDKVYAYATAGDAGGSGDRAVVYDSAGDDTFLGRTDYGRLTGNGFLVYAQGFDRISAYANSGGIDSINNRSLSYLFFPFGTWENIL